MSSPQTPVTSYIAEQMGVQMRPSNRQKILDAAFHVIESDGIGALTFEAVADASGISRGGLLYHFKTKDELVLALHQHLAERWERWLTEELGTTPDRATSNERVAAYAQVSSRSATGAELLVMVEASVHPELKRVWSSVATRWVPDTTHVSPDDPAALDRLIAVLAADGLWASEAIGQLTIAAPLRAALAQRIAHLLDDPRAD